MSYEDTIRGLFLGVLTDKRSLRYNKKYSRVKDCIGISSRMKVVRKIKTVFIAVCKIYSDDLSKNGTKLEAANVNI